MMRHLFIARHGKDSESHLTGEGCQQIESLGKVIKEIIGNCSVYVVSSTINRAVESSEVLVAQLGLQEFERNVQLTGGDYSNGFHIERKGDLENMTNFIKDRGKKAEALILITHGDVVRELGGYFLKENFNKEDEKLVLVANGKAAYFDFEKRRYRIV